MLSDAFTVKFVVDILHLIEAISFASGHQLHKKAAMTETDGRERVRTQRLGLQAVLQHRLLMF